MLTEKITKFSIKPKANQFMQYIEFPICELEWKRKLLSCKEQSGSKFLQLTRI